MSRVAVLMAVLTALSVTELLAETYAIDKGHSAVQFSVRHIVSRTSGRFNDFTGRISYDPAHPAKMAASATIQVGSIDTESQKRDGHLKSADFFDVANHPTINFKSTSAESNGESILLSGDLTMHGVTKKVELPVEILGVGVHPMNQKKVVGLTTEITLKRSDFGVNSWTDPANIVGDEVKVSLTIEAIAAD